MQKGTIKGSYKKRGPGFIVFTVVCIYALFLHVPQSAHSLVTTSSYNDSAYFVDSGSDLPSLLSSSYIHRGDWEPPDILLVVDDHEWLESLQMIVAASQEDGIPAYILVDQDDLTEDIHISWLKKQNEARIMRVALDTPWIRDYGPVQIKVAANKVLWLDFDYAGNRPFDDSVPYQVADYLEMPIEERDYYLEGGAIISNGHGLCAITEKSLEEASVDPLNMVEFNELKHMLGCLAMAVLPALTGESTGHADIIAQFLAEDIVAVSILENTESSEISAELDQATEALIAAANSIRQTLRVVRLPMYVDGEDFYSYVNGTRLRKAYLVPSFDTVPPEMELVAYRLLNKVMPGVRIVPIPADKMVQRGGAVHCITLGLNFSRPVKPWTYWVEEDKLNQLQVLFTMNNSKRFQKEYR
jgi:agmatine deiminase